MQPQPDSRLDVLDVLRGVAVVGMFLVHFQQRGGRGRAARFGRTAYEVAIKGAEVFQEERRDAAKRTRASSIGRGRIAG